jgi:hypothetical protein
MSDMNRLRELAALLQPKRDPEPVAEAKTPEGDFAGIRNVVEDALADLYDKLGEGGTLETMVDKHGVSSKAEADLTAMVRALDAMKKVVKNSLDELEFLLASTNESLDMPEVGGLARPYVLALQKGDTVLGYYYADDEDVVKTKDKAAEYDSKVQASKEARLCNSQWDLPAGQRFVVVPLREDTLKADRKSQIDQAKNRGGIEAYGVKGMKSTPWRKSFKDQAALEKWLDKQDGDVELQGSRTIAEEFVTEMAAVSKFTSGMWKSREARQLVRDFKDGETTIDLENGDTFKAVKTVKGGAIAKGMTCIAHYDKYNQGCDLIEILGVTDNDAKYGDGGVKFNSVKDLMKAKGVSSLNALEKFQDDATDKDGKKLAYGHHFYIVAKDLARNESGAWYYLSEGRWARGSGAEPITFVLVEKA